MSTRVDWPLVIYQLRLEGLTHKQIGKGCGISHNAIRNICRTGKGRRKDLWYDQGVRLLELHQLLVKEKGTHGVNP